MNQFASYANYYDDAYQSKPYKQEVDKIEEFFAKHSSSKITTILSLGCGTGTYEIELARRGYTITGVDLSADMLDKARAKISGAGLEDKIELIEGDIRSIELEGRYDAVLMMFNIAGYLHAPADLTAVVRNIGKHVESGSLFIFDVWNGPAVELDPPTDREKEIEKDGRKVLRKTTAELDKDSRLVKIAFSVIDQDLDNEVVEQHPMRYWFLDELTDSLRVGGYQLLKTTSFKDITQPITDNEWDMFVVASKL